MSGYSDIWYEQNKTRIEREAKADRLRLELAEELNVFDMLKIMFKDHLGKQDDGKIFMIAEEYLGNTEDK